MVEQIVAKAKTYQLWFNHFFAYVIEKGATFKFISVKAKKNIYNNCQSFLSQLKSAPFRHDLFGFSSS